MRILFPRGGWRKAGSEAARAAAGFGAVGVLLLLLVIALGFWAAGLYLLREDVHRAVQQLKSAAPPPREDASPLPLERAQFAFLGEAKDYESAIRRNVVAPYLDYQHRRNREILSMVFQAEPAQGEKNLRIAALWREGEKVGGEIFALPFLEGDKLVLPLWAPPPLGEEEEAAGGG